MPSLTQLHERLVRSAEFPFSAEAVAVAPAALPAVDLDLRQPFRSPQSFGTLLSSAAGSIDVAVTGQSRQSAPAPLPSIDAAIPQTRPSPPRESSGEPSSASDV
jgi:hypothetical protein